MATRNNGNMASIFENEAAMVAQGAKNNRRLEYRSGERFITSQNNTGSGIPLSTGNFANPISTPVPVATETTFGGFKYTFVGGVLNLITV